VRKLLIRRRNNPLTSKNIEITYYSVKKLISALIARPAKIKNRFFEVTTIDILSIMHFDIIIALIFCKIEVELILQCQNKIIPR